MFQNRQVINAKKTFGESLLNFFWKHQISLIIASLKLEYFLSAKLHFSDSTTRKGRRLGLCTSDRKTREPLWTPTFSGRPATSRWRPLTSSGRHWTSTSGWRPWNLTFKPQPQVGGLLPTCRAASNDKQPYKTTLGRPLTIVCGQCSLLERLAYLNSHLVYQ